MTNDTNINYINVLSNPSTGIAIKKETVGGEVEGIAIKKETAGGKVEGEKEEDKEKKKRKTEIKEKIRKIKKKHQDIRSQKSIKDYLSSQMMTEMSLEGSPKFNFIPTKDSCKTQNKMSSDPILDKRKLPPKSKQLKLNFGSILMEGKYKLLEGKSNYLKGQSDNRFERENSFVNQKSRLNPDISSVERHISYLVDTPEEEQPSDTEEESSSSSNSGTIRA